MGPVLVVNVQVDCFRKILILSSWMADERISWRRKLPAVISYVSFREEMTKNFSIDGLASSLLSLVHPK